MDQVLLRSREAFLNVESPKDWIMLIKPVTLDANGFAVVDLKNHVRENARVYYTLLSESNVWHGAQTTAESLTVNKGGVLLGVQGSASTDFNLSPITVTPDDSLPTLAIIFFQSSDIARHGESFV